MRDATYKRGRRLNPPEKSQEWRIVVLVSFVPVLFCGLLNGILSEGFSQQGICLLYFLGFTVLPVALYGIQRYGGLFTKTSGITPSGWLVLCLNLLFCFWVSAVPVRASLLSGMSYLFAAYLLLIILRPALFKNSTEVIITPIATVTISAAILGIVLLAFLNTFVEHLWFDRFDGIATEIPHFGGWPAVLVGAFAIVSGYALWQGKVSSIDAHSGWTLLFCFSPLLLFSIQSSFDIDHYDAFVAPAIAVLHGRVPLGDVFSQYGLGYLLFTLAFLVLPNTYTVCASIVSLMNIAAFVLYLLMLRIFIKNAYAFCLLGFSSIMGIYFCNGMSINLLPSALGFRYLPSMLFVYFLLKTESTEDNKLNSRSNVVFLLFNALWSLECLVFYFLIAGFYRWLMTRTVKAVFLSLATFFIQLMLGILVFFCLYYLIFKQFPNYIVYLEHPLSYIIGKDTGKSFHQAIDPFTNRYLFFLPMALMSMIVFYFSLFGPRNTAKDFSTNKLYLVNFSGIVFFVYIAVHSFVFFIKLEFIFFVLPFFGTLWLVKEKANNEIFKWMSSIIIWITSLTFFCVFVSKIFYYQPVNAGVNDSVIYHIVHFNKKVFKDFWYNFNNFCNKPGYSKNHSAMLFSVFQNACQKYDFHQEIKEIIDKYYRNKEEMIIFSVSAIEILFENHKYHSIMVNPMNDMTVDATENKIIQDKIDAVKYGDIVVVDKDIGLDNFESEVLTRLGDKFEFNKIDETPHLWVFKLANKKNDSPPWFLGKKHFIAYLGKNGLVDYSQTMDMEKLRLPSYFYYDQVLTIEMDFEKPFLVTGLKLWHLIGNRDVIKYRFFSNNALKNFTILVSEDKKNWKIVLSEENYFMNDKKNYYKDITPITAKYLRLNALIDSPVIAVSKLEVFGRDK